MADEIIVKRLHVSGLTPAITPTDLSQKLGSFGTVKALDGFGKVDGLGQPRKFGYVTIETTKAKLARCMNLLSGVTWKGAELRLGEAKPDYRERLAKERSALEDGEPPRKKRRLPRGVQGVHASDMSLVTPENASERGGWKVTPLGRIVKPMRMRPGHPLPAPLDAVSTTTAKTKKRSGKAGTETGRKRRVKEPPGRARRRTIDPLKWGSTQLKGVFLENAGAGVLEERSYPQLVEKNVSSGSSESEDSEEEHGVRSEEDEEPGSSVEEEQDVSLAVQVATTPTVEASKTKAETNLVTAELLQEKNAALGLLQSLFGDRNDDDWADRESMGSDVEMDDQTRAAIPSTVGTVDDDIEEVPMEVESAKTLLKTQEASTPTASPNVEPPPTGKTKLKDLFAPQGDNAGFSLLGHLDLDLELDDDVLDPVFSVAQTQATIQEPTPPPTTITSSTGKSHARFTLDSSLPLFFPLTDEARESVKGRAKDFMDIAKEKGWDWRTFCRTQTSEEIKQRWESQKVELTKDWKRRHREAVKSRRRRGGVDGE